MCNETTPTYSPQGMEMLSFWELNAISEVFLDNKQIQWYSTYSKNYKDNNM